MGWSGERNVLIRKITLELLFEVRSLRKTHTADKAHKHEREEGAGTLQLPLIERTCVVTIAD